MIEKIAETPRGTLEWVMIRGEGKEDLQGNHKYQAQLVLDPENDEEHAALIQRIKDFWTDNKPKHIAEAKSMGFYDHTELMSELDEDGEKQYAKTGKVALLFKTGTTYKDGKTKVIKVFNSKNNVVEIGDLLIGNGSIGRVSGAMAIYEVKPKGKTNSKALEAGVTLYLDAIKLLKLEEYQGGPQFGTEDDDMEDTWGNDESWEGDEPTGDAPASGKKQPRL